MTGKSPDDLVFKPDPSPSDPRQSEWYLFSAEIDDLLADSRYSWAEDTLSGIQETVQQTERVTEGQRRAVTNISESRGREREGSSRRYRWRGTGRNR